MYSKMKEETETVCKRMRENESRRVDDSKIKRVKQASREVLRPQSSQQRKSQMAGDKYGNDNRKLQWVQQRVDRWMGGWQL